MYILDTAICERRMVSTNSYTPSYSRQAWSHRWRKDATGMLWLSLSVWTNIPYSDRAMNMLAVVFLYAVRFEDNVDLGQVVDEGGGSSRAAKVFERCW